VEIACAEHDGGKAHDIVRGERGTRGVPLDELLASPRAKVRKWDTADVPTHNRGTGLTILPLVPEPVPDGILETMTFAPSSSMRGTPHLPGTREYFTCLEGRVTIFVAGERNDLAAGDVLAFPGNVPHSYRNEDGRRGAVGVILAKAGV
jgi:quercetin dioxygenase-like cupin family protein